MKRLHIRGIALAALILAAAGAGGANAADLGIRAFFGKFHGGGVAENADSIYFGVTARDFDVVIAPEGEGFSVTWTSVIRGGGSPGNPDIRRKTTSLAFEPSARPGIWRAAASKDPLDGGELGWARIQETTLSVYLMVVRDDGTYEIQRYDRKLVPSGMELVFSRMRDGDQVRTVKGRLVKVAN